VATALLIADVLNSLVGHAHPSESFLLSRCGYLSRLELHPQACTLDLHTAINLNITEWLPLPCAPDVTYV